LIIIDNSFNRCFFDLKSRSHIFYKIPSDENLHKELISTILDAIDEGKTNELNSKIVKVVRLEDFELVQYRGNELRFIQRLPRMGKEGFLL